MHHNLNTKNNFNSFSSYGKFYFSLLYNLRSCCDATSASRLLNIKVLKSIFQFFFWGFQFLPQTSWSYFSLSFFFRLLIIFKLMKNVFRLVYVCSLQSTSEIGVSRITSKMKLFVNFLSISFKANTRNWARSNVCAAAKYLRWNVKTFRCLNSGTGNFLNS